MPSWWSEIDDSILECLARNGVMAPEEVARALGISEGETAAFLSMLVREGRVRIRLVELDGEARARALTARAAA
jgi:DNA-binding Lrp family transcriptional regulator